MVYDPVRDIELPSPAASSHHGDSHPSNLTPGSGYFDPSARPTSSSSSGYGIPYGAQPPAFQSGGNGGVYSPTAGSGPQMRRSVSGGLRGLLNDDQEDLNRRRSSGHTASSADQEEDHRPSIHHIMNEGGGSNGNMTKSNSRSSIVSSSPANASPGVSGRYLDQSGFLTPASTSRRTSRSPYPINTSISPGQSHSALPFHDPHTGEYDQPHPSSSAGPSRRRTSNSASTIRPMLPPDTIPRQEYYDSSRTTPGSQILPLPLRSPSVSVSPRSHHQALPGYPTSRPGSATSSTHPFSFQAPAPPAESPSYVHRHLSEDRSRDPSESRSRQTSLIPRIPSGTSNISRVTPARSPSPPPAPARQPYNPRRTTQPGSVLRPIQPEEIAQLRSLALVNNPLRRRRKKALPSWSGPSPGPSSRSTRDTPGEGDTSYFPNTSNSRHTPETSRRVSDKRRRDSISSGRPSLTPGTSMTPGLEVQDDKARGSGKRKQAARDDGRGAAERDSNGHDGQRRKVNDGHYVGNNAVASHYNARPEVGVQSREFSPIIGLKKFNNWIKSVLIGKFTPRADRGAPGARVLDIGCGKGGDLNKWRQAKVRLYVGLDIADMSVDQARERYNSMRFPGFEAYFFAHDCYAQPLSNILPDALTARDMYDNVTMQFCMHYAFESASKARMMIENVSRYLKRGGIFIGTIPDAELLLAKLDEVSEDSPELRFGNSCYFVTFTERKHQGMYGHAYRFYLQDAVDDVPEYVVHWENFVNLAMEYGLRLVYKKPFHQVLAEEQDSADFGLLLQRMGVVNPQGESAMDADQWEAANLYMAFAFEKY